MPIDYNHSRNLHTTEGALAAFRALLGDKPPASILDVGCGTGTWLRAALDGGVTDILGIDGIQIPPGQLLIPMNAFRCLDLTEPVELGRKFGLVLCLEVAEHLAQSHAETLLRTLVRHSDLIIFSAACPGQPGQHHVNCQWPEWWQKRFNALGYVCEDNLRPKLWDASTVEPWYRQNIFTAYKDPGIASLEPRLKAMIHPELLDSFTSPSSETAILRSIETGGKPVAWYLSIVFKALAEKVKRRARTLSDGRNEVRSSRQRPI